MSYNGYPNWETWNTNLWLNNVESLYIAKTAFCRSRTQPLTGNDVKEFVKGLLPHGTPDFKKEGGRKCYTNVHWDVLADSWNYEYKICECIDC